MWTLPTGTRMGIKPILLNFNDNKVHSLRDKQQEVSLFYFSHPEKRAMNRFFAKRPLYNAFSNT